MKSKKLLQWFRAVAIAEGISFIVLLGIAMPLKYVCNLPMAVRVVGMIHGILFISFITLAWENMNTLKKSYGWFGRAFAFSVIPFGTFILDKDLKKESGML